MSVTTEASKEQEIRDALIVALANAQAIARCAMFRLIESGVADSRELTFLRDEFSRTNSVLTEIMRD